MGKFVKGLIVGAVVAVICCKIKDKFCEYFGDCNDSFDPLTNSGGKNSFTGFGGGEEGNKDNDFDFGRFTCCGKDFRDKEGKPTKDEEKVDRKEDEE